ncbi:MAG: ESX secretion-associated protein EspG [Sciscionella sp.]
MYRCYSTPESDQLRMRPVPAAEPAVALVRLLAPAPPGRGKAVNVRKSLIGGDGKPARTRDEGFSGLAGAANVDPEVDHLLRLAASRRTSMGQLSVALVAAGGSRNRCPHPLTYFDIAGDGRWFTTVQRDPTGQEWIVAAPATFDTLVAQLSTMLAQLL